MDQFVSVVTNDGSNYNLKIAQSSLTNQLITAMDTSSVNAYVKVESQIDYSNSYDYSFNMNLISSCDAS